MAMWNTVSRSYVARIQKHAASSGMGGDGGFEIS